MPHPPEAKAQARREYEQGGSTHAANATGIPIRTIRDWAAAEHWQRTLPATAAAEFVEQQALAAAKRVGWGARKRALGDEAGQAAAEALQMFRERVQARKVYGLEPLARSFSLLVERAEQMTAGTGAEGTVSPAESLPRLREIFATLAERKVAGDG